MPDTQNSSSRTPTYAEVLSSSPEPSESSQGSAAVTSRRHAEHIRSERSSYNIAGSQRLQDIDGDEDFMFEESLRRGDVAQARRRRAVSTSLSDNNDSLGPRRSQEMVETVDDWSTIFPSVETERASLPTIIHPHAPTMPRSPSPDDLALLPNRQARRSLSLLSQTSARRSESIFFPVLPGNEARDQAGSDRNTGTVLASSSSQTDPWAFLDEPQPRVRLSDDGTTWLPVPERPETQQIEAQGSLPRRTSSRRPLPSISIGGLATPNNRNKKIPVLLLYCGVAQHATTESGLPKDFYQIDSTPSTSASPSYPTTGGCGTLICARGKPESADPEAYESDSPPVPSHTDWLYVLQGENVRDQRGHLVRQGRKQCKCVRASIGCRNCGNAVGYATIRSCARCVQLHGRRIYYYFYKSSTTPLNRKIHSDPSILHPTYFGSDAVTNPSVPTFDEIYMSWPTTAGQALSKKGSSRLPYLIDPRDMDIKAGLAGDPIDWAERGQDLIASQCGTETLDRNGTLPEDIQATARKREWVELEQDRDGAGEGIRERVSSDAFRRRIADVTSAIDELREQSGSAEESSIFFQAGDTADASATVNHRLLSREQLRPDPPRSGHTPPSPFVPRPGRGPGTAPVPARPGGGPRPSILPDTDENIDALEIEIDDNERVMEEAERVFMASATASNPRNPYGPFALTESVLPPIPAGVAETLEWARNAEDRTLEEFRSSSAAIVQRARALRRDIRDFVDRLPGTEGANASVGGDGGRTVLDGVNRRRRSMSPRGEFDEMTERILRDARRRRVEASTSAVPASEEPPRTTIHQMPRFGNEMVGR